MSALILSIDKNGCTFPAILLVGVTILKPYIREHVFVHKLLTLAQS